MHEARSLVGMRRLRPLEVAKKRCSGFISMALYMQVTASASCFLCSEAMLWRQYYGSVWGALDFESRCLVIRESKSSNPFSNFDFLVPSRLIHFRIRSAFIVRKQLLGKAADGRSSPNRAYDSVRGVKILVFQFL